MHAKRDSAPRGAAPSDETLETTQEKGLEGQGSDTPPEAETSGQAMDAQGASEAEAASPAGNGASLDPAAKAASLEAELADLNDRYLRKVADMENFRKRTLKEKEEIRLYANTELLVDLISLLDDFDRAIQSSEAGQDWKTLHDGVSMIQKAFLGKLEGRYGLKRFDSAGEDFDPVRHEALMAENRADVVSPVVVEDLMKGYCLHERVIRPAKVKVAMPPAGGSDSDASGGEAGAAGSAAE